jgi:hypothetical protein
MLRPLSESRPSPPDGRHGRETAVHAPSLLRLLPTRSQSIGEGIEFLRSQAVRVVGQSHGKSALATRQNDCYWQRKIFTAGPEWRQHRHGQRARLPTTDAHISRES